MNIEFFVECLSYDPDTGIITWRERPKSHFKTMRSWASFNAKLAGSEAGNLITNSHMEHGFHVNHGAVRGIYEG